MIVLVPTLLTACAAMMLLETRGLRTTLRLSFKGDLKRESQWLGQYGQAICTIVVAALIWQLDPPNRGFVLPLGIAVGSASLSSFVLKRLVGRVRPNREQAGRFLGPNLTHRNCHESFPSSHAACAVALTVALSQLYPQAMGIFWALALSTAALRYLLDAHWPSDIIAGIALGYLIASLVLFAFGV